MANPTRVRLPSLTRPIHLMGAALLALALSAQAQSVAPLLQYDKPDRSEKLIEAAGREGTLTLYTAFRPQDLPAVLAPFEARTGIKVKAWRSGSNNVTQRVLREAAGKRPEVDVIMMPASELAAVDAEQLLQPVATPHFKDLIAGAVAPHRRWSTVFMNVTVQAYNTSLIKKEDLPRTYQDLLDPKWKGKLGVETKAEEWFTRVVTGMGEEKGTRLFKDIMARNGMSARLGVSLLYNLVIAGEVPLALTVYIDLPEKDKRAGKPVDWFALEPVVAQGFNVGLAKSAPHPNAAMLFYDYMLSPDTQKLLASLHYYPANAKVASPYPDLKLDVVDPVATMENFDKWSKAFEDTVTKQAR
ncbi:MAG: ABC transporter substrate-binding protein [Burkholderiaceae bacterium]|jgi:iron(III) transport system substrate-binding protein